MDLNRYDGLQKRNCQMLHIPPAQVQFESFVEEPPEVKEERRLEVLVERPEAECGFYLTPSALSAASSPTSTVNSPAADFAEFPRKKLSVMSVDSGRMRLFIDPF